MQDMIASIPRENQNVIKKALEAIADPDFHNAFVSAVKGMTSPAKAIAACLIPLLKQMESSGIPEEQVIGPQGAVVFLVADMVDMLEQAGMEVDEETGKEAVAEIQKLGSDLSAGEEEQPEEEEGMPEEPEPEGEDMDEEEEGSGGAPNLGGIMAARQGAMRGR